MSLEELAREVQGHLMTDAKSASKFSGVSIDSRTLEKGQLFIAIRGEHNDGHQYIPQAIERGATGVLADSKYDQSKSPFPQMPVVVVEDTHAAMIRLASNYRRNLGTKIIGVTGSNGKTTTKEFTYALLKAVEPTAYRSHGNLNNLFGAPLALLSMPQNTKAAAIEMGISTKGEMEPLAELVQPDAAIITNIGPSHLEFLNSVEDVARAKLKIVSQSPDVPLVINADDALLVREASEIPNKIVTFGINNNADFMPSSVEPTETGSQVTIGDDIFSIGLVGRHMVYNLLAAYAAIRTLGYDFANVDCSKIPLKSYAMRGELIDKGGVKIINDAYNANPESVKAGLEAFKATPTTGRRILILGDMLELGVRSEKYHREIGNLLVKYDFAFAILVGERSRAVLEGARQAGVSVNKLRSFKNAAEAAFGIGELVHAGDLVYVKGSRGVELEKVIEKIGGGQS